MDIGFVVNNLLNKIINTANSGIIEFNNVLRNFYEAGGVSETLKQNGIILSPLYTSFLLKIMKNKRPVPKEYAEDVSLVKDCIDKYGGFD